LDEEVPARYQEHMRPEEKFILSRNDLPRSPDSPLRLLLIQEGFAVPEPVSFNEALGKIEALYGAGIRVLQPVYFGYQKHQEHPDGEGRPSSIGSSSFDGKLGEQIGLTKLGREVCRQWLELGGILDGSHASPQALRDIAQICRELSRSLLISHSAPLGLGRQNYRCLSGCQTSQLKQILGDSSGLLIGWL
jgi:hypothetical protein